jgi:hypothetical protein
MRWVALALVFTTGCINSTESFQNAFNRTSCRIDRVCFDDEETVADCVDRRDDGVETADCPGFNPNAAQECIRLYERNVQFCPTERDNVNVPTACDLVCP